MPSSQLNLDALRPEAQSTEGNFQLKQKIRGMLADKQSVKTIAYEMNVPEPEVLLNATDPWVTCVQYDFDQPLEQDSLRWIGAAAQRSANLQAVCEKFAHVALALHGGEPGAIELTSTTAVTAAAPIPNLMSSLRWRSVASRASS